MKQLLLFLVGLLIAVTSAAGPGHDHGDAPAAATGVAAPRFGTHSDLFELVGVLEHDTLVLYLDRYDSNEPVTDARIEVAGDAVKGIAEPVADGTYRIAAPALETPGRHALIFTISRASESDLLEGSIEVAAGSDTQAGRGIAGWLVYWPYPVATLSTVGVVLAFLRRRRGAHA